MTIAPDDLEAGKYYRFSYVSWKGINCTVYGEYVGTVIDLNILWFLFIVNDSVYYFDYEALGNLQEVTN